MKHLLAMYCLLIFQRFLTVQLSLLAMVIETRLLRIKPLPTLNYSFQFLTPTLLPIFMRFKTFYQPVEQRQQSDAPTFGFLMNEDVNPLLASIALPLIGALRFASFKIVFASSNLDSRQGA